MIPTHLRVSGLAALLAGLLLLATAAPDADARRRRAKATQPTKVRLDRLGESLPDVPFGGSIEDALKWSSARLERSYAPRLKSALDGNERARLREEQDQRLGAIRDGLITLGGQRTGYEVSVIAGEYVPGVGESLLRHRDGDRDHYLFFSEGDLYKYARPVAALSTYKERLKRYTRDHGEPTRTERLGGGRGGQIEQVVWEGERYRLRLMDRRTLFGADLMVVEDLHLIDRVTQRRGKVVATQARPDVEPELEDFLE